MKTIKATFIGLWSVVRWVGRSARRSFLFKFIVTLLIFLLGLTTAVFFLEHSVSAGFKSIWESFWWLIVVLTKTPGSPGTYPTTVAGRVITLVLLITGISFIPLVTAKIASYMVTRRLREEKGLERIKAKKHTVIFGWNEHLDTILDSIAAAAEPVDVVLINSLQHEKVNEIVQKYKTVKLRFVYGDFTNETILQLANIRQAALVTILADISQNNIVNADERSVLGTLAVRTMNANARVCVEVMDAKSVPWVKRAGATEVVVHGENDPFMIASAVMAKGVVLAVRQLLSIKEKPNLQEREIPVEYIDRKFCELAAYFREKQNAILIGLCCMGRSLEIEDVLKGDYSLIDEFIERKFREAGKQYLSSQFETPQANLVPGDDYRIRQNEVAIVIVK